ncbi:MAG: hypothetical protein LAT67_08390 [Balneolales bacterium]|nr:hypothetical protein [Balneolales bacterium]
MNTVPEFINVKFFPLQCFSCFIVSLFIILCANSSELKAQNNSSQENQIRSNQDLIIQEVLRLSEQSEILEIIDKPFTLSSNIPEQKRLAVFRQFSERGLPLQINPQQQPPLKIQFMLYTQNSLTQRDSRLATRSLTGELQLMLSENEVLVKTESLTFSFEDNVPYSMRDELAGDWLSARFHKDEPMQERNLLRSVGRPALLVTATAVTVFLLFNQRSS